MYEIIRVGPVWMARSAVVGGDVVFGEDCNVWHHCVIRGDVAPIRLGDRVNVQDSAVLHCKHGVTLEIASEVAIGHRAVVHCKQVGSRTLIGIGATVLDDCEIGEDCIIAAGAVLAPGTIVPDGSVVMGVPGKIVRPIREEERAYVHRVVHGYIELARQYAAGVFKPYEPPTSLMV
ncbi:MAG TPA: gamma carbonic anhydrase family protein [Phycisphaerae bacterium]|jgi:carbonic anhydrase/acetyltransferase-like protein (isoleucine patch superfamily)|nr:gamma carbonic anhydrase family protein [Phycisphaerae bacterium]HOB73061.1 gamma carbonic anhydrase family protein [Phycisphaerae bacterium]HOJ54058.1 gamma carbonic anhydrase family protein [Phycisphaerae bacterium]HOL26469.1 gamma carbonic anhydrase family protein [Phycisphaerae bacterium]HPP20448.1 gamma carbonic anhydrase family protein [Phycisphaerae bacterium]